jgi:hypothetical protein
MYSGKIAVPPGGGGLENYTVNRIRMSPTPTLNIYLFEGPIY